MKYILSICCLFLIGGLAANNIEVSNVSLTGQNAGAGTTQIKFDLNWENSWRISVGPSNYDAAWVFAKYRVNGNTWRHCTLSATGQVAAAGSTVEVQDNIGAFVYRDADGAGDVNFTNLELRWEYDNDGVDASAVVDIQVFAIEMVYVPEGEFSVGTNAFDQANLIGNFYSPSQPPFILRFPYRVEDEGAITVANTAGNLYYAVSEGEPGDQLGPIPANFPKGFAAFYCMKYETTQDQWVSFFNTLSDAQKTAVDVTGIEGKNSDDEVIRNAISWNDVGNATTTLPNVPLNYVRNTYLLAYLDWSGLRPMTELEFEKACRGPLPVVDSEYAWGNSNIHANLYIITQEGTPSEGFEDLPEGVGNAVYQETNGLPSGPKRVGIFAASSVNNTREETGGSYFGIMEMTGNVYERCISVGNPEGRAFTGAHGDGTIGSNGLANVTGWPIGNEGIGYRGGSYPNSSQFLRVSDRNDAANSFSGTNGRIGFRGVRTAQ